MEGRAITTSVGAILTIAMFIAVELSFTAHAVAKPRPENSAVIDFGNAYCDVSVHDVHASVRGDISSHSTVACFSKQGGGGRLRVEQMKLTTTFAVFQLDEVAGGTIDSCSGLRTNKYSYELPCHVPWQGPGLYGAKTEAQVTHDGRTLRATASNTQALYDFNTGIA
ncbi:hypothetical protein ACU61A_10775 [Pseudonocardia sichuanensis]